MLLIPLQKSVAVYWSIFLWSKISDWSGRKWDYIDRMLNIKDRQMANFVICGFLSEMFQALWSTTSSMDLGRTNT